MKKYCIAVTIILMCIIIHADTYKLKDLINHAIDNSNIMIKSFKGQQNVKDTHSKYLFDLLPSINYNSSYTYPAVNDYRSSLSIGKSLSLNEPSYFNIKRSMLDKDIVALNHQNQEKKIALEVLNAYIDILQTKKNIDISEQNIKLQRRIHNQVLIQYQSNRKTIFDVQQSQIDTLDSFIRLTDLNNTYQKLRENLFFMINMEDKGYELEIYDFEIDMGNSDFDANLNIESSSLSYQKSKTSLTQQYLSLFPDISLNYSWNTYAVDDKVFDLLKTGNYKDSYTFSINLSYPLLNHFDRGFSYRIAKRNLMTEKLDLDNLIDETKKVFAQTQKDKELIYNTYSLYEQKHALTKTNLQIAEERFALGIISSLDLDKARIQYLESEIQLVNRYYSLIKKQEELNYIKSDLILGLW